MVLIIRKKSSVLTNLYDFNVKGFSFETLDFFLKRRIDGELFEKCSGISRCRDSVSQYEDYEEFKEHGLGCMIMKEEALQVYVVPG